MGMSAEDFGAVLAELNGPTPLADAFETCFPQQDDNRWWFSIRTHATSVFLSKEYFDFETARRNKVKRSYKELLARKVWESHSFTRRPELRLWILEALGLLKNDKEVLKTMLEMETNTSRCTYLKDLFTWDEIDDAARKEFHRLVTESPMTHRNY